MYPLLKYSLVVTLLCLFSSSVKAQNAGKIECLNATSAASLNTSIYGDWYEASRSPASTLNCVNLNLLSNSSGIFFSFISASKIGAAYVNTTLSYGVTNSTLNPTTGLTSTTANDSNAPPGGFIFVPRPKESITVKILKTDYFKYALVCGYSNVTNNTFGAILTRQRVVSNVNLSTYAADGNSSNYADFGTLTAVNQNAACYKQNSAASHVSVLSLIFATIYATLKLLN